ncbi:LCP family protein [Streptomyces sp. NPDC054949]|uniref:LCP family protein n=1 Tax=unclassified Streptomyces TaxID=2593676 RepID=UPI000AA32FC5|nr:MULTISPECIES: LCP family protein [unclassified Streptomyces]MCX5075085.1 LCP family protein [Streptomyces sp. NBC_00424]MCX5153298.1 LCP family protein [Streptomyces sp. NBC_00291]WUD41769.1 LCP family protein [Streptomyces sp. NBC_00513]
MPQPHRPTRPARPQQSQRTSRRGGGGPARRRRDKPRWGVRLAAGVSIVVLGSGAVGHAVMTGLDTGIERVDPFKDMKNRPQAGHGVNFLLVGTDGREKITPEEKREYRLGGAPCHCTDTIMLVHLSADRERASVISLPRDSYAEVPAHRDLTTGKDHKAHGVKLNAAYAEGGPNLTVRTVENMTRVKIDHYLEVDFTSFMRTVDAMGGVDICTAKAMRDANTGLDLLPGTHRLTGGQALQYVRSRHVDGASDLGRMQRQQRFVAALIKQATGGGVLLNPVKFKEVSSTLLGSVRADEGFGSEQMLALGQAMREFTPSSSEFASVPIGDPSYSVKGIGSTVKWDQAKAAKLFDSVRRDQPLQPVRPGRPARQPAVAVDVPPAQIRVQVENGTRIDGLGGRVDEGLRATGFDTTRAPGNGASREVKRTVVSYDPRWDRSARTVSTALPGSELRAVAGQGRTVLVIAGADYKKVVPVRAEDPYQGGATAVVTGDQVVCAKPGQ